MKNRLTLLVTILLMSGLWSFAQVAPEPQPQQPKPKVQPPPPAPQPDIVELRIGDETAPDLKTAEFQRVYADMAAKNAYAAFNKLKTEKGSYIGIATSPLPQVVVPDPAQGGRAARPSGS